jgi:hypothetical protein
LDESRHQLQTQLHEQRSVDQRQAAEADDFNIAFDRKGKMMKLVDKLAAIKLLLRFQETARERESSFKASIRQKRAAFDHRLARMEKRMFAERYDIYILKLSF